MPRPKGAPNKVKHYAFTLVPTKAEYKNLKDLNQCYDYILGANDLKQKDIAIEFKKDGTPHIHAYVTCNKSFFIRADRLKGYSFKIETITDLDGWLRYVHKDDQRVLFKDIQEAQKTEEAYYALNYAFIED